jgi:hypothetical protein
MNPGYCPAHMCTIAGARPYLDVGVRSEGLASATVDLRL